jgi:hypothetical protein
MSCNAGKLWLQKIQIKVPGTIADAGDENRAIGPIARRLSPKRR